MTTYISISDKIVGERDGYVDFVVTLDAPSSSQVTVNYGTISETANSNYDFVSQSGQLVFAAGVTTQTVRVTLRADSSTNIPLDFGLSLSSAVNAVIARGFGTATIVDKDLLADATHIAGLSVRDVVVDAKADTVSFGVVLDRATTNSFSVGYSTSNGSALAGSEYIPTSGTLSFAAGETAKTVTVSLPHDGLAKPQEVFYLNLGAVSGNAASTVKVADGVGQALIGAHGQTAVATPTISVGDTIVGASDGYVDFVVTLNAPSSSQVNVNYGTANATADSNYDFVAQSGQLVFAPGVTTQTVRVALRTDLSVDIPLDFNLNLSSAVNGVIARGVGTATIIDKDVLADTTHIAGISVRDVVVDGTADTVSFAVVLDKATTDSFSVVYGTSDGNALVGRDYTGTSGTLSFGAGETAKTIIVSLPHDGLAKPQGVFYLNLGAVSGNAASAVKVADGVGQALIGAHGQTAIATPAISVSDTIVGARDGYVDFLVTLNAPSNSLVSVNYGTFNETANSNYDFVAQSGQLVFAPGVTTQTVRVALRANSSINIPLDFGLSLGSAVNAVIARGVGTATIIDKDLLADTTHLAGISVRDVVVDGKADTVSFAVVLDRATSDSFSVGYATSNGSAVAGPDYTAASGILTFGAGETAKTITVVLPHDGLTKPLEIFNLTLGAISGNAASTVQVTHGTGHATIGAHGQPVVATPVISVTNIVGGEKIGYIDFQVSLNAPSNSQVSVNYGTAGGTANSNYDYVTQSGQLIFAPGVTTQTVRVALRDDSTTDISRDFTLNLSNATNAVIGNTVGTGTIVNNSVETQVTGGVAIDTVSYNASSSRFTLTKVSNGYLLNDTAGLNGTDLLVNVERIHFSDKNIALDTSGTGGEAYRIYQAAFNRTPDGGGLGYWISVLDKGASLKDVGGGFVGSAEFQSVYGTNPTNAQIIDRFYQNVLHRAGESGGVTYWNGVLDSHSASVAEVLGFFSESTENQAGVIGVIQNGFAYIPYG